VKEQLTEDEVIDCKKAIYHIVGMESRSEPLPINTAGIRGKGAKRLSYSTNYHTSLI
jgi:hypothetical protein